MPTLSEAAKNILEKNNNLAESNDPTPDRDAQQMTPNAQTLRPMSKGGELGRVVNPKSNPPMGDADDELGPAVTSPEDPRNYGAIYSKNINKDTGWQHKPAMPVSQTAPQGLAEDEEIEISEELQEFIDDMLEEGYSEDEILEAIEENFEVIEEGRWKDKTLSADQKKDIEKIRQQTAVKDYEKLNDAEIRVGEKPGIPFRKPSLEDLKKAANRPVGRKKGVNEAIDALLEGEDFSDDFRNKATTIFEAAVNERVEDHVLTLEEAYAAALEEEVANIQKQLTEQVDSYLNYAVQEWINENEVAIETGLRTDITEDFMSGLKNLFAENYIDLPEEKVNVVEGFGAKIQDLEAQLNEEIERNIENQKIINEAHKYMIVTEATRGLTETQASKLHSLSEKLEFNNANDFEDKVETLKESYFPTQIKEGSTQLDTDEYQEGKSLLKEETTGRMSQYLKALDRTRPI